MLYIVVGENTVPANAQDLSATNKAGKIHRITPDGAVPADNPIAGNTIWAYGIRNSFGFGFDPTNDQLWANDNGPECNDEVDRIVKGGNYAWGPHETCSGPLAAPDNTNQDGPLPQRKPKRSKDNLVWIDCQIHRLTLNAGRTGVVGDDLLFDHTSNVLALETRAGQPVYFSDPSAIYRLEI